MAHDVGDSVRLRYEVRDEDNNLTVAASVVLTITRPDLTPETPTVTTDEIGVYRVDYLLATAGRYVGRWLTTVPNTSEAFTIEAELPGNLPVLQDVKDYLDSTQAGLSASYTDAVLNGVLAAERAAQARKCRVPAFYPTDLREALLRRCQRNLAMRGLPLAVLQGDAEVGSSFSLPGNDPEVRRLELPHRRVILG